MNDFTTSQGKHSTFTKENEKVCTLTQKILENNETGN